jgi:hypothetical protein
MSEEHESAVNGEAKEQKVVRHQAGNENFSSVRVNDTVGTVFLGVLAILMLVFLVRSNRRNRELLLEVISLRKSA